MAEEKVEKLSLTFCRFCGAYAASGEYVEHRNRCRKPYVQGIDHIPVVSCWCPRCGRYWPEEQPGGECPGCRQQKLVRRYV